MTVDRAVCDACDHEAMASLAHPAPGGGASVRPDARELWRSRRSFDRVEATGDPSVGSIAWDEAADYAGTTQRVCGPFAGTGNSGNDVFLNLGRDYPDPERFQILIWDIYSVEPIPIGATVCATGRVAIYKGVTEMVLETDEIGSVQVYG